MILQIWKRTLETVYITVDGVHYEYRATTPTIETFCVMREHSAKRALNYIKKHASSCKRKD